MASINDGEDRLLSGCTGAGAGTGTGTFVDALGAVDAAALGDDVTAVVSGTELDTAAFERGRGSIRLVQITSDTSHKVDLIIHSPACVWM
ncbi:hypothetical protein ACT8ZS_15510 [Paenibacillus sp. M.A.Huq-84]